MKKKDRVIYSVIFLTALLIFLFSAYHLFMYIKEDIENRRLTSEYAEIAVIIEEETDKESLFIPKKQTPLPAETEKTEEEELEEEKEDVPISVNFEALWEKNRDVVAWLYCAETRINYPIVQAEDNDYYLIRMLNGAYNKGGSIFMDYRNSSDFSDVNTVIYGHNMKNGSMFGDLEKYKDQEYYAEHPGMWLITPEKTYKIELLVGCLTEADSEIYTFPMTQEYKDEVMNRFFRKSTFQTDASVEQADRLITLSTCSYEFDDARYVVIGTLREYKD